MGVPILTSEGFVGQRKIMGKTDKLHRSLVSGLRVRTGWPSPQKARHASRGLTLTELTY